MNNAPQEIIKSLQIGMRNSDRLLEIMRLHMRKIIENNRKLKKENETLKEEKKILESQSNSISETPFKRIKLN